MKCTCKDVKCKSTIKVNGHEIWIDARGQESLIYADRRARLSLILDLIKSLVKK